VCDVHLIYAVVCLDFCDVHMRQSTQITDQRNKTSQKVQTNTHTHTHTPGLKAKTRLMFSTVHSLVLKPEHLEVAHTFMV